MFGQFRHFVALAAILSFSLAQAGKEYLPPEVRLEAGMSSLSTAFDCVNVRTGEFFLHHIAVATEGPSPLYYARYYNSDLFDYPDAEANAQYYAASSDFRSWGTGFATALPLRVGFLDNRNHQSESYTARFEQGEDVIIPFTGQWKSGVVNLRPDHTLFTQYGYTNCSSGHIEGANTLKNTKLCFSGNLDFRDPHPQKEKACEVTLGDGTLRRYSQLPFPGREHYLHLTEETLPNGHKVHYEYGPFRWPEMRRLHRIRTTNPAGTMTFHTIELKEGQGWFQILANNGQATRYDVAIKECKLQREGPRRSYHAFVSNIASSQQPKVSFDYQYKSHKPADWWRKLIRIEKPNKSYLNIKYYRLGSVKALEAPLGPNNSPVTFARFEYWNYDPKNSWTNVFDAYGIRTAYAISEENRIVAIDRLTKDNQYYCSNRFFWANEGIQAGNLLAKAHFKPMPGERDRCLCVTAGTYDERSNLIREDFYGNLSGHSEASFELGPNHRPNRPVECFSRIVTYSDDRFNLPLREEYTDGKFILHTYLPETNLPTSELVGNDSNVLQRTFYSYDDNNLLIETISDDGSGHDPGDLTGVTCRTIKTIVPRLAAPAVGFPHSITESYLDLTTGHSKQLRRTENVYDDRELLIAQHVYDANDTFCYTLEFGYDARRNLIRQTDPLRQETLFEYGQDNHLKIREELVGSGFYTLYRYDLMDRLVKTIQKHDNGDCFVKEYRYDLVGNKIAQVESYNQQGSEEVDAYSNEISYVYDEFRRETEACYPACATLKNGYQPSCVKKSYNVLDQVTTVTDQNGNQTTSTYTTRGQPVCVTYPDGTQERYEYHLNGTLAKKWEKDGLWHHYVYDGLNRPIRTDTYDAVNTPQYSQHREYVGALLMRETDAMKFVTEYTYDGAGRKIGQTKTTNTGCERLSYSYDSLGRLCRTQQWYGPRDNDFIATVEEHDFLDRLVEVRKEDAFGTILRRETYAYDRLGNRTETRVYDTLDHFTLTETRYNSQGLPKEHIDALGNNTQVLYNYNVINPVSKKRILEKTTVDPLGNKTLETYDALGRLVCTEKRNAQDKITAVQETCYDLRGQKVRQRHKVFIGEMAKGDYIVEWQYDNMGRITLLEEKGEGLVKRTKSLYDRYGRLQTLTKPDGVELSQTYDALGRLETLTSSDGTISYHYAYDLHNNPILTTDLLTQQSTTRAYDAWGHLVSDQLATGERLTYTYDSLGRLFKVTLPDQSSVQYHHDAIGLKTIARMDPNGTEIYRHEYLSDDLAGRELSSQLIGRAGRQSRAWDPLGRNTHIDTPHWSETIPTDGYDAAGNLRTMHTTDLLGNTTATYTYDDLYQLITEAGPISHTYQYDSLHNRVQKDNSPYTVNGLNQVTSESERSYSYDPNGNLIRKVEAAKTTIYCYDALNRLITAEQEGIWQVGYSYDSFGRRLMRTLNTWNGQWVESEVSAFLYQGQQEIGTIQEDNIVQLRVLGRGKGAEVGATIALELRDEVYAPVHDHRGNICCLLDSASGKVVQGYRYTAYGELTRYDQRGQPLDHSVVVNPWLFASKRQDPHTCLFQFGKRDYDSNLGRWLTPDPIGFADGPNLYAYVHNNPLTLIDPWGLAVLDRRGNPIVSGTGKVISFARDGGNDISRYVSQGIQLASSIGDTINDWSKRLRSRFGGGAHACVDVGLEGVQLTSSMVAHLGHGEGFDINERLHIMDAVDRTQAEYLGHVERWVQAKLGVDPSDPVYQASRYYTKVGLDAVSVVAGGYGLAKGGFALGRHVFASASRKLSAPLCLRNCSSGAESINAAVSLNKKLAQLEKAQQTAVRTRELADGRIRYYGFEAGSRSPGPTRGRCQVLEYNPNNGHTRSWSECYDHTGDVNRVHPKQINGQEITSQHYPLTEREL